MLLHPTSLTYKSHPHRNFPTPHLLQLYHESLYSLLLFSAAHILLRSGGYGSKKMNAHLKFFWLSLQVSIRPPWEPLKACMFFWNSDLEKHLLQVPHKRDIMLSEQQNPYKSVCTVWPLKQFCIERSSIILGTAVHYDAKLTDFRMIDTMMAEEPHLTIGNWRCFVDLPSKPF